MMDLQEKMDRLRNILREMGQVVVAYSGGVDSTFLLKTAHDTLGDKAYGVLAVSPSFPSREYEYAMNLMKQLGISVEVIHTKEMDDDRYTNNPLDRCYFCKSELFGRIAGLAAAGQYINMVDGTNFDDQTDHRPGMKALKEKNVRSPLLEAALTKDDIRELSRSMNLPTWNKDELACLSSRLAYGETITIRKLQMVDQMENFLADLGFHNIRARYLKNTLRIEIDAGQIERFFDPLLRKRVIEKGRETGFSFVSLDLEGYRRGSMNEEKKAVAGKPAGYK